MAMKVSTIGIVDESIQSFDELNAELLKATKALDSARRKHRDYCEELSELIVDYKVAEARAYAESSGLDLSKPVAEQRQQGKKSPGTINEHEAYVINKLASEYKRVEALKYLVNFWDKQMDAAKIQISALQSIGANMRNDPALSGRPEPRW
jgi:chorismate mutase